MSDETERLKQEIEELRGKVRLLNSKLEAVLEVLVQSEGLDQDAKIDLRELSLREVVIDPSG